MFSRLKWNMGQRSPRLQFNIIITVLALSIIMLIGLLRTSSRPYIISATQRFRNRVEDNVDDSIPNQVHYIWALNDTSGDLLLTFEQYLSVYSVWYYWKPHTIYLHTNAGEPAIARARDGVFSKWAMRILSVPNLKVNLVEMPNTTRDGVKFRFKEHISDFARVKAVHDYGGIYIDFDIQPLRDVAVLRKSGFNAIGGRQEDNNLNSGSFMSKKGSKMVTKWMDMMHEVYDGRWTTHSNDALTAVARSLVPEPGEMLIMDREAFAPVGWTFDDARDLFGIHNETTPLEKLVPGQPLPTYNDRPPAWARDFSASYLIHCFTPDWSLNEVEGVTEITPAYVLKRQSNFAYATYPVVRDMYHKGLVTLEDKER
ncbi:glycosyl transferase [Colletotrichum tofieldiae]|uniref:Glycosyl transferase n=1 Tax=Colletotrichum tofieldiae TaxID=708197 RepID=A0A161VX79_9PEZI|nr:glycosyl transferase [Colletotrichum tofieldiae]